MEWYSERVSPDLGIPWGRHSPEISFNGVLAELQLSSCTVVLNRNRGRGNRNHTTSLVSTTHIYLYLIIKSSYFSVMLDTQHIDILQVLDRVNNVLFFGFPD